jgi:hypothetical protein
MKQMPTRKVFQSLSWDHACRLETHKFPYGVLDMASNLVYSYFCRMEKCDRSIANAALERLNDNWNLCSKTIAEQQQNAVPTFKSLYHGFVKGYRGMAVAHREYGPGKEGGKLWRSSSSSAKLDDPNLTAADDGGEDSVSVKLLKLLEQRLKGP